MPRILRIINRFNLGGPTYNVAYLTKYLAPEFETLLIGGEKDISEADSDFIVENLGIEHRVIPEMKRSINPLKDLEAYRKIKSIIEEFKPDIVHTHASKAGSLGRRAAMKCGVPVIVHTFHGHVFHSYFNPLKVKTFISIERKLAKISTKIVAISELQKKELTEVYSIAPKEKVAVIPLGFDLSRFRENIEEKRKSFRNEFGLKEDEIAIGLIGRLAPVKNHKLFIDSIKIVAQKSSKRIRGFIIGDGETKTSLEEYCNSIGVHYRSSDNQMESPVIEFTSWIKDVDRAYAGLDIVALTSKNEGTPVSLIEAQAAGKPIVTTNAGGVQNAVSDGNTAIVVKNDNPEEFSSALLNLVENEELRNKLSLNGWDFVEKRYHYTRLVEDMRALYHSLLNGLDC